MKPTGFDQRQPERMLGTGPARSTEVRPAIGGPTSREPSTPGGTEFRPARPGRRPRVSTRLIGRAIRRRWWQAAALWVAGTAGLVHLARENIATTREASTTVRVEPGTQGLARESNAAGDFEVYKETQVERLTHPDVVARAIADHPEILNGPTLASAVDPEGLIRDRVRARLLPKTNLIRVSISSVSGSEAASIVNAVVDAFLKVAISTTGEETNARRSRLREVRAGHLAEVARDRVVIAELVSKLGSVDAGQVRDRNSVAIEQYRTLSNQLIQTELEVVDAQAVVDQLRTDRVDPNVRPASLDPSEPEAKVVAAFYATPAVSELLGRQDRARQELLAIEKATRDPADPSRLAARKSVDEIQKQIDIQWSRMKSGLSDGLARVLVSKEADFKAADRKAMTARSRLAQLNSRLDRFNAETKSAGSEGLTLEFARQDLIRAESVLETVSKNLEQLEFEARDPVARFRQEYKARGSPPPRISPRVQAFIGAPVGMLAGVVLLMVFFEARSPRVADPDEFPDRLRVEVLGLVPPLPRALPTPGQASGHREVRSRRELDQFIQSLDHLRVVLCSGKDAWGRPRRSVLITSGCQGEGKTTLAAQLAERSASAGLMTLLIDGDIRNPSLSRLFGLESARGLANILRGEAIAEESISIVGSGGGFHFLPAGSPRTDPTRLLEDERLGKLLASARESFDLVLVDSPPVLPVPDALTIGRWVDGAVLAVRLDSSRYPLVEQANQRLASVGVPVIGAIVNGVRGLSASYYGPYSPVYGSTGDDEVGAMFEA